MFIMDSLLSSLAQNCHPLALTEPASAEDMAISLAHSCPQPCGTFCVAVWAPCAPGHGAVCKAP